MSADAETTVAAADTPEAVEPDPAREALLARLQAALGGDLIAHHLKPGDDLWVRVRPEAWRHAGEVARDILGCRYFCFLSGLDWLPSPYGRGEDDPTEPPPERSTTIEQGYCGGDTRFQVFARVMNIADHIGFTLKVDVPDATMAIESWSGVYAGADWHERETWEMFGIAFEGHPGLKHIYLPGEFEGNPLRKDFPLLARAVKPWPGIVDVEPMPPGADDEAESGEGGTAAEGGDGA